MAGKKIRILLADDHATVRRILANLLGECPDIEVVGEARDGQMAVLIASHLMPDVVLMDVSMPVLDGIEATRLLKYEMPQIRVIALSMHKDIETQNAMLNAGASRYLCKTDPPEVLIEAIKACTPNFRDPRRSPSATPA